jgi:5-methylcytosine-specific restriction endonuclease McrA
MSYTVSDAVTPLRCPSRLRQEVKTRQGNRCLVCGMPPWSLKESLEMHRIVPAREGGHYRTGNVVAVCRECHVRIEGLTPEEIRLLEPYLPLPESENALRVSTDASVTRPSFYRSA